jgi:hypothetical protein
MRAFFSAISRKSMPMNNRTTTVNFAKMLARLMANARGNVKKRVQHLFLA